jgi:hypothetical protein
LVRCTAHDMGREHRVISALGRASDVPVPVAIDFCDDVGVTGGGDETDPSVYAEQVPLLAAAALDLVGQEVC